MNREVHADGASLQDAAGRGDRYVEWVASNAVEREMADALAAGDGSRYAALLLATPLYLPALPEPGSEEEQRIGELLPPGAAYVLAYTSAETLAGAIGERGYERLDFAALRQRWPDPSQQLAVNPGSPIGVFLPPSAVADVAEGKQSLVSLDDVRQAVGAEALTQIRCACLRELAGEPAATAAPRDDVPVNELETALREAANRQDQDAFLAGLLGAEVVLPTTAAVADPEQIYHDGFPWRVVGGEQAPSVPVFSSAEMLARTVAGGTASIRVHFLDLLANWPDQEYVLILNPGSVTELLLPGTAMLELASAIADRLGAGEVT